MTEPEQINEDQTPIVEFDEPSTGVLVGANITPEGLVIEVLIPLEAVGINLAVPDGDEG